MKYYVYVSETLHNEENMIQNLKDIIKKNKDNSLFVKYKIVQENITAVYIKETGTKSVYKFKAIIHI